MCEHIGYRRRAWIQVALISERHSAEAVNEARLPQYIYSHICKEVGKR